MAFEAPCPNLITWVTENADEIIFWIALGPFALLHIEENLFEAHDRRHFHEAALAHGGTEQRKSETLLGGIHIFHRQPLAFARDEMPVETFLAAEIEFGFGGLFRSERGEQRFGSVSDIARILGGDAADRENGDENREQELFHGRIVAEEMADSIQNLSKSKRKIAPV